MQNWATRGLLDKHQCLSERHCDMHGHFLVVLVWVLWSFDEGRRWLKMQESCNGLPPEGDYLTFHPAVRCHSQVRNLFTVTRDQNLNSISKEHNVLLQDSNLQGLSQIRNYCVNQEKPLFCFVPTLPAFPLLHDLVPDNHVIMVFKFLPAHLHQPMLEAAKLTTLPSMVWVSRDFTVKHLT